MCLEIVQLVSLVEKEEMESGSGSGLRGGFREREQMVAEENM